jgi:isopentenyl phosphate kinase
MQGRERVTKEVYELVFVKLGGSVITDKTQPETARPEVIARLAGEIAAALAARAVPSDTSGQVPSKTSGQTPSDTQRHGLRVVLGHGSGSFGHVVARRYGTRQGVYSAADWRGFAEVAAVAARLNRIIADTCLAVGMPVWSLPPSASASCRGGELVSLAAAPVEEALKRGLVPLIHGDVALDELQGGTIISTEQIFAYLARRLHPARLVLVGVVDGVYERDPLRDPTARRIPEISAENWTSVRAALGGSHATDVTGGMLAKVEGMVNLVRQLPGLTVHLVSGERPGALQGVLLDPATVVGGTVIR